MPTSHPDGTTDSPLLDHLPHAAWVADPDGRTLYLNRPFRDATGLPADADWLAAVHPDDRPAVGDAWHLAVRTRAPFRAEARLRRADGTVRRHAGRADPAPGRWVGTWTDVEDDRRAADALARDALILANVRDAVVTTDLNGVVTSWNDGATRQFGWTADEMIGRYIHERVPDHFQPVVAANTKRLAAGLEWDGEFEDYRKDGSRVWIHARVRRFAGPDGNWVGILGLSNDIHQLKAAEALLALQTRVLEAVGTGAPLDRVLDRLARGVEDLAAGLLCSVLLVSDDGRHLRHGAGPSLPDEYNRLIDGVAVGPAVGSCGTAAFRREPVVVADIDADPLWAPFKHLALAHGLRACWSTPVLDRGGKALATFAVYYREPRGPTPDELRLVETAAHLVAVAVERHRAEASLVAGEKRFRAALEGSMDAVYFLAADRAPDGTVTDFVFTDLNDPGARLISRRRDEVVGRRLCELIPVNRTGGFFDKYARVVETGVPLEEEFPIRVEGIAATWLHHQVVPLGDGVVITTRDVSGRRRLEEEHRQAQKMEAVGRLAGGVAHDFNNLLTVILGNTDLALVRLGPDDRARPLVEEVRAAAERAAAVTGQLLAFSRKELLQPKAVDLTAVVAGLAPLLTRALGEDVRLAVTAAPGLRPVLADPGRVEQVLTNLVINARDAMPAGGTVTVTTAAAGDEVVLAVADTGPGIPPDVLPHVFEPFFTTKPAGAGTGLGLATVHGIARAHGGRVEVDTEPGRGTTFRVYLPAAAADVPPAARPAADTGVPRGTERVLLVEDEEPVRRMTRRVLAGLGYAVQEAADAAGAEAVVRAAAVPFDLLLTDVVMPGVSGRELAERLAADHPGLRVLFVSGHTTDAVLRRGVEADKVHFLAKPFTPAALGRKVREVLDRGR